MTRRCAEIKNGYSTYIFYGIIPLCNFQYRNRVRSITLIPFVIISQNLVVSNGIKVIERTRFLYRELQRVIIPQKKVGGVTVVNLCTVTPPTFFVELFPFVIFRIEIVSAL